MSVNTLPEHFTTDYARSFFHRIQQFPSRLANAVTNDSIDGEIKRYSQLESQEMADIVVRHGPTNQQNADTFIRWMKNKKGDISNILDEWDEKELGVVISPKGRIIENHGFAYNRRKDDTILRNAEGDATTGEDADVLVPLPASQTVGVAFNPGGAATDSGMTFAKVARMRRIFRDNDLDLARGMTWAVISPQAEEELIRSVEEARNKDYGNFMGMTPIQAGGLDNEFWMGFNWVIHTGIATKTVTGAGGPVSAYNNLFWHKSFVYFGDGEKRSNVDILPTQSHGVQCRTRTRMGAMRFEEKGVVAVETLAT